MKNPSIPTYVKHSAIITIVIANLCVFPIFLMTIDRFLKIKQKKNIIYFHKGE